MQSICRIPATLALVVLLTSLAPRLALAAEPTEDDANAAAMAGRYQEALEAYTKLYSTTREPTYLHNIARCHQKLGHPDEAIDYFNRYLREAKDLEENVKIEVRGYLREMKALKEGRQREKAAVVAAPAPASPLAPVPGPGLTRAPASTPALAPSPTQPPVGPSSSGPTPAIGPTPLGGVRQPSPAGDLASRPNRTLATEHDNGGASSRPLTPIRKAAAVAAGVGVLAAGVGVYYGIRSRMLENQVTSAMTFDRAADNDGATAHTMQFVMYGVAGALLAGSAVLVYLSRGTDTGSNKVSLLPSVGSRFAGGTLIGRF